MLVYWLGWSCCLSEVLASGRSGSHARERSAEQILREGRKRHRLGPRMPDADVFGSRPGLRNHAGVFFGTSARQAPGPFQGHGHHGSDLACLWRRTGRASRVSPPESAACSRPGRLRSPESHWRSTRALARNCSRRWPSSPHERPALLLLRRRFHGLDGRSGGLAANGVSALFLLGPAMSGSFPDSRDRHCGREPQPPAGLDVEQLPRSSSVKAYGAPICQYKVCSTSIVPDTATLDGPSRSARMFPRAAPIVVTVPISDVMCFSAICSRPAGAVLPDRPASHHAASPGDADA